MKNESRKFLSFILAVLLSTGSLWAGAVRTQAATTTEMENNDLDYLANTLKAGDSMVGNIGVQDIDYYKFTFIRDSILKLDFHGNDSPMPDKYNLNVYDESLSKIDEYTGAHQYTTHGYSYKSGTVLYITVSGDNSFYNYSADESYTLTPTLSGTGNWETESNDTIDTATVLSKKTYGTLSSSADLDYYKYTAPGKGYVQFNFANEDKVTGVDGWNINVYDSNRKVNHGDEGFTTSDKCVFRTVVKKGTVIYLEVSNRGSGAVFDTYSITPVFKSIKYAETESNNSFSKADTLTIGKSYSAIRQSESDVDYFKFKAKKSKKYKVTLSYTRTDNPSGAEDLLTVYSPKKKKLSAIDLGVGSKTSLTINAKKGKTYYISVSNQPTNEQKVWCLYHIKVK